MKLIDELFEHYRTKLTGEDEDIDILVLAVLEQLSHNEILECIMEMDDVELRGFLGMYIAETLKGKFAMANPTSSKEPTNSNFRNLH